MFPTPNVWNITFPHLRSWSLNFSRTFLIKQQINITKPKQNWTALCCIIWKITKVFVAQKWCIFDPMLVNPKCAWETEVYLKNCKTNSWRYLWKLKKLFHLSNTFWLYQHAPFQCYIHFFLTFFKQNKLYHANTTFPIETV